MKKNIHLPKLYAAGYELDTSPECFGMLRSSNEIISNSQALQTRIKDDGYIFLSAFFDCEQILTTRKVFIEELLYQNIIDTTFPLLQAKAHPEVPINSRPEIGTRSNPTLDSMIHSGSMIQLLKNILGGPIQYFEYTWYRAIPPGKGTRPHCDIVYMGRTTKNILTAWVPIGNIPLEGSGLMILEDSHRKGNILKSYLESDVDEYCIDNDNTSLNESLHRQWDGALSNNPVILQKKLGGRWLTSEFNAGDLVIFSSQTVHGSLDNLSDFIRLSVDCRYQLASEQIDERWIGKFPIGRGLLGKKWKIC
ncbi:phytanoyl-CoA dioxygenase family protein [Runella sp. MFBS21]|uniref:phytanoyl-CoA dioxygenase family protein n=1 Tax=Runella sp. MFBS21 TaxID=3034018 RepID=UPI0023F8837C|nr:phytanoyl-CoA dioxygenase family protein [Runella sp. MFBS21]MDF7822260.1 phytanoyl-CoA dioxygenase family protein [Runella sp. MFBS21]